MTELRFVGDEAGYGVFATALIPRGTIVWALDPFDRTFDRSTVDALPALLRSAVLRGAFLDPDGGLIFCWDHGRSMNHSCEPSCLALGTSFKTAAVDLHPGEELSSDYGSTGVLIPFDCLCGSSRCRRRIEVDAAHHPTEFVEGSRPSPVFHESWEGIARVPQPLLPFAAPIVGEAKLVEDLLHHGAALPANKARSQRTRTSLTNRSRANRPGGAR